MREILYRAKRANNGDWVIGSLFVDDKKEKYEICIGYVNYRISYEVIPETVGQYTGLTDKNGTKIFEDDIIVGHTSNIDEEDGNALIEWDEDTAKFVIVWSGLMTDFDNFYPHDLEVIGNIHDNPELLETE
jgi:uncharacterized phage protein (TIGR01671 family)